MNEATKFLQWCKLTCIGGSERGLCDCHSPAECKLREDPRFPKYRREAHQRQMRHLQNEIKTKAP